jgi:hypothetical protein
LYGSRHIYPPVPVALLSMRSFTLSLPALLAAPHRR